MVYIHRIALTETKNTRWRFFSTINIVAGPNVIVVDPPRAGCDKTVLGNVISNVIFFAHIYQYYQ